MFVTEKETGMYFSVQRSSVLVSRLHPLVILI